ncbi:conserved exported hypothetical protein [Sphingomonas sp. EC-HK361]|uniref:hypothetical protein n=1 Tax=Sphingomonas sp. EC-HK361 TaxID=2038397 RepID=UPI001254BB5F|nr:hypothetical protein [Sphingomonas sp. EC-HK361]VVS98669.1 conserved exported hypothetical protein [Sphingomonas sp. EC-HK361]
MVRKVTIGICATIGLAGSIAFAKEYQDYTPQKGLWRINAVEVDPNHVDDYLTGLRKSQIPNFEVLKAHGVIDSYKFLVRTGYNKGSPNVLIQTHLTSAAMLNPDKARDEMMQQEAFAKFSEADGKAAVAEYDKYRTFIDNGLWSEIVMTR